MRASTAGVHTGGVGGGAAKFLPLLVLLLALSTRPLAVVGVDVGSASSVAGTNVVVTEEADGQFTVAEVASVGLPHLPVSTRTKVYGELVSSSSQSKYDGVIVIGGILSMGTSDAYYGIGQMIQGSLEVFTDWLNMERGGVSVGGKRYGIRFVWVDDASSVTQTPAALAYALRPTRADFAWAGYSSGLTFYAAKQAVAEKKIMMSGGAATTSVFTQPGHDTYPAFGLFYPSTRYTTQALETIVAAAAARDKLTAGKGNGRPSMDRCGGEEGKPRCVGMVKAGFIQADTLFTKAACAGSVAQAKALGMTVRG